MIINRKKYSFPYVRDISTIIIALLRVASRNGVKEFFSYIIGKNSKIFYQAIIGGHKLRIGKDFNG
jgi:GH15 family glucan-1,4-alpha-glucosidase